MDGIGWSHRRRNARGVVGDTQVLAVGVGIPRTTCAFEIQHSLFQVLDLGVSTGGLQRDSE